MCFLFVIGISSLAEAAPRARRLEPPRNPETIQLSTRMLVEMPSIETLVQELPQSPCGEIDPNKPCYMGSTSDPCIKATSYATCKSRCECQYSDNKKKCRTNPACIDLAATEKSACVTNCLIDWA